MKQIILHKAPFDLRNQNSFFGGWPILTDTDQVFSVVMAFPVEGTQESAAVVIEQTSSGQLNAKTYGPDSVHTQALNQALAVLSLDIDDSTWQDVGKHDKVIASLQKKYNYIRPVLFHSPYEAAAGFVIGQRISVKQRQALQAKMAEQYGQTIEVEDQQFVAFPSPQELLKIKEFKGINSTKIERLHGVARAAMDGKLGREYLLGLPVSDALTALQSIQGIGPFYASGILYRGAGIVDDITDDRLTKYAIKMAYDLKKEPNQQEALEIVKKWTPYRMWCEVLIHIWLRREVGMPKHGKL
jgi:3-methyladenine DNA glycosylase/8-oxoguanine DNA glycosylase